MREKEKYEEALKELQESYKTGDWEYIQICQMEVQMAKAKLKEEV